MRFTRHPFLRGRPILASNENGGWDAQVSPQIRAQQKFLFTNVTLTTCLLRATFNLRNEYASDEICGVVARG
jgi:hypothetical protein